MALSISAHAKINLTLHVTGQRADSYHLLDSLVVFADAHDTITATPADTLRLSVSGPFSDGIPVDDSNLILRAAKTLRQVRGVKQGADLTLEKHLPHAAGIGSGSSDAAATLELLAKLWGVTPLPATAPQVALLGADVPVCLAGPGPLRMTGIGDVLSPVSGLPDCAVVLVNPKVPVPTRDVFNGLAQKVNPAMTALPDTLDFDGFIKWLTAQRNDLQAPALAIAPEIDLALGQLRAQPQVAWAGMSGSGATCAALVRNMADATTVAQTIQQAQKRWWVTPAQVLRG